jgi:hypothetical protein
MKYSLENGDKSRNGNSLEGYFTEQTGLKKFGKKQKPSFVNSHGKKQIIDFDFHKNVDGVDIYMDLTTTYRSDRLKQKAYNALMYKNNFKTPCKFYMVVGKLVEHGKKKKPVLIEGIDGVILVEDAINMIK